MPSNIVRQSAGKAMSFPGGLLWKVAAMRRGGVRDARRAGQARPSSGVGPARCARRGRRPER
eukprot:4456915-Pyramimonas_sp.AAC.1